MSDESNFLRMKSVNGIGNREKGSARPLGE